MAERDHIPNVDNRRVIDLTVNDLCDIVFAKAAEAFAAQQPPPPLEPPGSLTAAAVRDMLHIGETKLWNLEKESKLTPCARMGRKRLYRRSDVEALLNQTQAKKKGTRHE